MPRDRSAPSDGARPRLAIEERFGARVRVGDRLLVSFAGCDYLGLSQDHAVTSAVRAGLDDFGLGSGASRVTSGTTVAHLELEAALARFFDRPAAALLPDGTLANRAALDAVGGDATRVAHDRGCHPSLTGHLPSHPYDRDAANEVEADLVLTDGVFPGAGVVAPLATLLEKIPAHGTLLIDDCHGTGVLGRAGRGSAEHCELRDRRIVLTGTLSKALGGHGGFVVGEASVIDRVRGSLAYVTSTPIPPALARGGRAALARVEDGGVTQRLASRVRRLRAGLARLGLAVPRDPVPVFAIQAQDAEATATWEQTLAERGFLVPHIHYPGGPPAGYLRLSASALHTAADLDALLEVLAELVDPTSRKKR